MFFCVVVVFVVVNSSSTSTADDALVNRLDIIIMISSHVKNKYLDNFQLTYLVSVRLNRLIGIHYITSVGQTRSMVNLKKFY